MGDTSHMYSYEAKTSEEITVEAYNQLCYSTDTLNLTVYPTIGMQIITNAVFTGNKLQAPPGNVLDLSSPDGYASYLWAGPGTFDNDTSQSVVFTASDDGLIIVQGITPDGCLETASDSILLDRPLDNIYTVFTPNDDGINDEWIIPNAAGKPDLEVYIFDRWGQQVFYASPYGTDASHTFRGKSQKNGKDLPVGSYYYIIKPNDGSKTLTGTVTIVR